jgi:predicted enzyme related to lactoylglutathione lyase
MEGQAMNLKQSRLVTKDVQKLNEFYENLTGAMAEIISSGYVELERSPCAGLAITSTAAAEVYGEGVLRSATNRSLILDFAVKDVDAHYTRLKQRVGDWVQPPIDLPWRNRTMLLGDPDGNLINMFALKPAPAQK